MGAAQGEVHHRASGRCQHAPRGLRGHSGLMADLVEQVGLDQLGLRQRRGHLQQRFPGQHHPALRDGPDIAGEPHADQMRQFPLPVRPVQGGGERRDVLGAHLEASEEVQRRLNARGHQEPPVRWQLTDEQAEGGRTRHALAQIGVGHAHLIQVGDLGIRHMPASLRLQRVAASCPAGSAPGHDVNPGPPVDARCCQPPRPAPAVAGYVPAVRPLMPVAFSSPRGSPGPCRVGGACPKILPVRVAQGGGGHGR